MRRPMRRPVRIATAVLIAPALLTFALWSAATPAQAAYATSATGGVLTLTGTSGDESSTVTCVTGNVRIDDLDPSTGAASCASITAVVVDAQGGNDSIFLDSMTTGQFISLTTQTINGSAGIDQLITAPVTGSIDGGDGNDRIYPGPGAQTIGGGAGLDTVIDLGTAGATVTDTSIVTPDGGTDPLSSIEAVTVSGTSAGETFDLTGFSGETEVSPQYGDDTVQGGSAHDFVMAGGGADTVNGNGGDDTLVPNDGDDIMSGGPGTDTVLLGDDGFTVTDTSATGPFLGSDTLSGFEVATLLLFSPNTIDASGFTGVATVSGTDGVDHITTGPGNDSISTGLGNDEIRSGAGKDTLKGQEGKDLLIAGSGNDRLIGGPNKDDCRGGAGQDILVSCP